MFISNKNYNFVWSDCQNQTDIKAMAVDMAVDLAKAMAVHSIKSLLHYANYIKIRPSWN